MSSDRENKIFDIPLEQILVDPNQPRKYFDEQALRELAESIKEYGLLQPILVKPNSNGGFQIVHGERRYRDHQIAALPTIRCMIQDVEDSKVSNFRVVENTARQDLSDMDLAKEFQRRVSKGETHEEIAKSIHKSRAFVTQRLALLRLPEERQRQLDKGEITFNDARVLASNTMPSNSTVENQHCYAVTMEKLEVYKLFHQTEKPAFDVLYAAYRKDMATLRRAKA